MKNLFLIAKSIIYLVVDQTISLTNSVARETPAVASAIRELRKEVIQAALDTNIHEAIGNADKAFKARTEVFSNSFKQLDAAAHGRTMEEQLAHEERVKERTKYRRGAEA